jgi:hypothetical protein
MDDHMTRDLQPPARSAGDLAHSLVKAVASVVPLFGGPAAELFAALVQPPIERRRDEWMRFVGELLSDLAAEGIDLDALKANEEFVDTVLQATRIALRNHQDEKRSALRNAIANTALGRAPKDMLRQIFLRYIDEFTVEHVLILKLFDNPSVWFSKAGTEFPDVHRASLAHVLTRACPQFASERDIFDQIWQDLYQRGLVKRHDLHTALSSRSLREEQTSALGKKFLKFIRSRHGE